MKFHCKGSFFQKTQTFLIKFPRLATSGRHNYAILQIVENSLPNDPSTRCLFFIFIIFTNRINLKSFRSLVVRYTKNILPNLLVTVNACSQVTRHAMS